MTVRALRRGSIAASRVTAAATTTHTIFGDTADGYVFASVPDSGASSVDTTNRLYVGQAVSQYYESMIAFDTSAVSDVATITSVTLSLYGVDNASATDFIVQARIHDWSTTVTTADWVKGSLLSGKTLVATLDTSTFNATGYNDFTSEAAFLTNINRIGFTRMLLCSSRHAALTAPSGSEYVGFESSNASGTSMDPKLVVVTTP